MWRAGAFVLALLAAVIITAVVARSPARECNACAAQHEGQPLDAQQEHETVQAYEARRVPKDVDWKHVIQTFDRHAYDHGFPRTVWLTMNSTEILDTPGVVTDIVEHLRRANPAWDVRVFGLEDRRAWLATHSPRALAAHDAMIAGAFQADIWRLAVLAKEGGVYLDAGVLPVCSLDALVGRWHPGARRILVRDYRHPERVWNGMFAALPHDPFFAAALSHVCDNVETRVRDVDMLAVSGPKAVGSVWATWSGRGDVPLEMGWDAATRTYTLDWTWLSAVTDGGHHDRPVLHMKYAWMKAYRDHMRPFATEHYGDLWSRGLIYVGDRVKEDN